MESLLNQEIREKLEEIISIIKNSKQYQEYLYLEKKMKNHSRIPKQIEKIKQLDKEVYIIDTSDNPKIDEYEKILKKEGL